MEYQYRINPSTVCPSDVRSHFLEVVVQKQWDSQSDIVHCFGNHWRAPESPRSQSDLLNNSNRIFVQQPVCITTATSELQ